MLNSGENPGAKLPPRWSRVSVSALPTSPAMLIVSVFVVVAAPHAVGDAPKWSAPPTTTSVACPPAAIVALTVFVALSYVHDSAAVAGVTISAATSASATAVTARPVAACNRLRPRTIIPIPLYSPFRSRPQEGPVPAQGADPRRTIVPEKSATTPDSRDELNAGRR